MVEGRKHMAHLRLKCLWIERYWLRLVGSAVTYVSGFVIPALSFSFPQSAAQKYHNANREHENYTANCYADNCRDR